MALFKVSLSFHFDTEYEVNADSYDEAEELARELGEEWKPYSSEKGYTDWWYSVDVEGVYTDEELDEDE